MYVHLNSQIFPGKKHRPRMVVVAGPPGSGKTTSFPLTSFGTDWFNADYRAAELNGGSYQGIPKAIRGQVNREFEQWILEHIAARKSFAFETTLRTSITFEQARLAREHKFRTILYYVSAGSIEESIKRVVTRSYLGGHSASERLIREVYEKSTKNLLTAIDFPESGIEIVLVCDNSRFNENMQESMVVYRGRVTTVANDIPPWLDCIIKGTKFDIRTRKP